MTAGYPHNARDLNRFVLPRFGSYRIGRLPADEIENWLNDEITAGVAPSSVHRHHRVLRRVLQVDPTVGMLERIVDAAGSRLILDLETIDAEPTLASLATAAGQVGSRLKIDWTRLRGFADWAVEHPDRLGRALASPPARTGTPLDAILAAFAEELAAEHGLPRPRWTRAVGPLKEEWAAPGTPRMRSEEPLAAER